ncbi:abasic site processing protein YoqW isoform X2 [Jatropha curcas]|uniref:abasic site processing protein YoqW isoform X2 n=1 Tax=Jatropha curcas TaxID=180498 RepID=UPI0018954258|nr:abasic site processing protein YoqW isoform X2 [Jatropha curcas]
MCGRARCTLRADDISRACHCNGAPVRSVNMDRYRPYYNVSPGSNLPVVYRGDVSGGEGYSLHCMTWGLVPSFTKKTEKPDFYRMFNARSESVREKASFRRLLPKNRCLVAVEGFYEWKKDGSKKQPYYIHFKDDRPLVFAALYDSWQNSEDRMPVILGDKGAIDTWLNGSSSSKFDIMLKPYENPDLVWYPVTPAMGKISFDGPECIKEIHLKTEDKGTISKFFSRKEIKSEQESNLQGSTCEKSADVNTPKRVKEEDVIADKLDIPSLVNNDSRSSVCTITKEDGTKYKTKRDYEETLNDSKLGLDKDEKPPQSPARKKVNLKIDGDKQPTLFSYFSKK